jgi:hypothetical protein
MNIRFREWGFPLLFAVVISMTFVGGFMLTTYSAVVNPPNDAMGVSYALLKGHVISLVLVLVALVISSVWVKVTKPSPHYGLIIWTVFFAEASALCFFVGTSMRDWRELVQTALLPGWLVFLVISVGLAVLYREKTKEESVRSMAGIWAVMFGHAFGFLANLTLNITLFIYDHL